MFDDKQIATDFTMFSWKEFQNLIEKKINQEQFNKLQMNKWGFKPADV